MLDRTVKIYVAGHRGLVGSAIWNNLKQRGYDNLVGYSHEELDLLDSVAVKRFFDEERPDVVVLAAAHVGGIMANLQYRADFIYKNLQIQQNVIGESFRHGVKKLLFLGSTCIYPCETRQPMCEDSLLSSPLEYTNEPYAIAKIAGLKMCESFNIQYGTNYIAVMPTNLYGPNDNFHLENSHVLPAIIRKIYLAKCLSEGDWNAVRNDINFRPVEGINGDNSDEDILVRLSARDVYNYLYERQIQIEAKGIAVGVRLEHPQELIDQIQYHRKEGRGKYLPAAEYSFVTQANNRGVYSFCMCPGGFVVPAASGPKQVVVNGMSPSNRGSRWSNSGMVVEIRPEDYSELVGQEELYLRNGEKVDADSPLALMAFQERLEEVCWLNGGMKQTAPAQRMDDFMRKKNSFDLPVSSYTPGLLASPLHFWMPEFVTSRLREGFRYFGKVSRGFLTNEATMIGVETRTSAPVRILRDRDTYQHVTVKGLFPCGEGAGYAGGIVSAAIDGERCAEGVYNLESNK